MPDYQPLRWGILGPGSIANRFGNDVSPLPDHKIQAVGSRDKAKADAYGDKFNVPNRHGSYEELVNDPTVDAIYVATPHPFHKEHSLLAINAGKAVLCEKPFTINYAEAKEVVDAARAKGVFLMEAMWSRCFPVLRRARELAQNGAIGVPRQLIADFGFQGGQTGEDGKLTGINPNGRLFDLKLGGGALMDVGCYPVSLAQSFFGTPDVVEAVATLGNTGVDENTGMLLHYPSGAVAITYTSVQVNTPQVAVLLGSAGRIEMHHPWWNPNKITVYRNGQEPEVIENENKGFGFEAIETAECLRAGRTESSVISLDDTLTVMKSLDDLRAKIGLRYPMD